MYTEQEVDIAKSLTDEGTMAFLKKVFTEEIDKEEEKIKGNILLDDAEYGRIVKVIHLNQTRNVKRLEHILTVSKIKKPGEKKPVHAPR